MLDQKDGRDCREMAANLEWLAETEITGKNIAHILQKEKKDSNMIWLGFYCYDTFSFTLSQWVYKKYKNIPELDPNA